MVTTNNIPVLQETPENSMISKLTNILFGDIELIMEVYEPIKENLSKEDQKRLVNLKFSADLLRS